MIKSKIDIVQKFPSNNLSNASKVVQVTTADHGFSMGYEADNGLYALVDLTKFYLASKSDLFHQNFVIDPNTCTTPFAIVNGWDSNVVNVPDIVKNKFAMLFTVWVYGINSTGKLDASRMQTLTVGQDGGIFTRTYENSAWSNWA